MPHPFTLNRLPTRVKYGYVEDGSKVRFSSKSGALIPKPERTHLQYKLRTKEKEMGDLDTFPNDVMEKTYHGEDYVSIFNEFEEYISRKDK